MESRQGDIPDTQSAHRLLNVPSNGDISPISTCLLFEKLCDHSVTTWFISNILILPPSFSETTHYGLSSSAEMAVIPRSAPDRPSRYVQWCDQMALGSFCFLVSRGVTEMYCWHLWGL
ncbi:hypothetical protein MPH_11253 [Macrophomina phaseolina MS6]|uniref:Uncharacterized protein n=1 Tax=Macrophomina phaseolina (strain MS6) TaxID=1126212 RepID=K2RNI0_MACPH|nr:hypothetical protein MPH_11253 [Macrophomina phaseolina MS6]